LIALNLSLVFLIGITLGSFANVCIYRLPKNKNIVQGRSFCPKCKKGHLVSRSNKFGRVFYSCDCYPSCKYTLNHKPVAQACPVCNWPVVTEKKAASGVVLQCPQKSCMHKFAATE
jgi:ssDNA-binding Zn-finger/Zn-ribbon topoisomerase 1